MIECYCFKYLVYFLYFFIIDEGRFNRGMERELNNGYFYKYKEELMKYLFLIKLKICNS